MLNYWKAGEYLQDDISFGFKLYNGSVNAGKACLSLSAEGAVVKFPLERLLI